MAKPIGLLHPGEMGGAYGAVLVAAGTEVLWASEGRGAGTSRRAATAGLTDAGTVAALAERCDVILSICPPHAAADVAESVASFGGTFVDCNAIAPDTARGIAAAVEAAGSRYVDGGIIGPPPVEEGVNRLYLSGAGAADVAALFAGTPVDARVVSDGVADASALKMAYAAWTKGTWALVLATRALARAEGVEDELVAEWALSRPGVEDTSKFAAQQAAAKGWRWVGEMEEIAASFAGAGLPEGFHEAAAAIYRSLPRPDEPPPPGADVLDAVLGGLAPSR
jgi:3-hydroxyisobutyrate dehydrogenase-like beta-hydroxyacid dehydrogenase